MAEKRAETKRKERTNEEERCSPGFIVSPTLEQ